MDDAEPSFMRMLVELLQANGLHEIDNDLRDKIKVVLGSKDSYRWQKALKTWLNYLPVMPLLFGNAQMMCYEQRSRERSDRKTKYIPPILMLLLWSYTTIFQMSIEFNKLLKMCEEQ